MPAQYKSSVLFLLYRMLKSCLCQALVNKKTLGLKFLFPMDVSLVLYDLTVFLIIWARKEDIQGCIESASRAFKLKLNKCFSRQCLK